MFEVCLSLTIHELINKFLFSSNISTLHFEFLICKDIIKYFSWTNCSILCLSKKTTVWNTLYIDFYLLKVLLTSFLKDNIRNSFPLFTSLFPIYKQTYEWRPFELNKDPRWLYRYWILIMSTKLWSPFPPVHPENYHQISGGNLSRICNTKCSIIGGWK